MRKKENCLFTKNHEWIELLGGEGVIGLTDYAAKQLGPITYIELPAVGKKIKKSAPLALVESSKAASDILCPVAGTVRAVNEALKKKPGLITGDPFNGGWIAKITVEDPSDMVSLLNYGEYLKLI